MREIHAKSVSFFHAICVEFWRMLVNDEEREGKTGLETRYSAVFRLWHHPCWQIC
jgi:hypothetical protein